MSKKTIEMLQKADTEADLITDAELDQAWGGANFGGMSKREVIRLGTLKCLAGWHQGHTSRTICTELGLINEKYKVTAKGRAYLWLAFGRRSNF
ncbi:hypothetical protein [Pseudomonas sp.]|uniref:hypothetical protein n=1 Tax=Pseudomonas sp. TaxID=306 RepID=UPI00273105D5|nr:hypothetical protein [Pseudomonas sp.]MDP2447647.1 hypothetical protein [Pseudomonas sp.]MDZ4334307.1 hypothetical protein [Pseudomonas sp.]